MVDLIVVWVGFATTVADIAAAATVLAAAEATPPELAEAVAAGHAVALCWPN